MGVESLSEWWINLINSGVDVSTIDMLIRSIKPDIRVICGLIAGIDRKIYEQLKYIFEVNLVGHYLYSDPINSNEVHNHLDILLSELIDVGIIDDSYNIASCAISYMTLGRVDKIQALPDVLDRKFVIGTSHSNDEMIMQLLQIRPEWIDQCTIVVEYLSNSRGVELFINTYSPEVAIPILGHEAILFFSPEDIHTYVTNTGDIDYLLVAISYYHEWYLIKLAIDLGVDVNTNMLYVKRVRHEDLMHLKNVKCLRTDQALDLYLKTHDEIYLSMCSVSLGDNPIVYDYRRDSLDELATISKYFIRLAIHIDRELTDMEALELSGYTTYDYHVFSQLSTAIMLYDYMDENVNIFIEDIIVNDSILNLLDYKKGIRRLWENSQEHYINQYLLIYYLPEKMMNKIRNSHKTISKQFSDVNIVANDEE